MMESARRAPEVLIQEAYYVYASMETDEGPRLLAAGGEPFCTSPSRFAILGRERCEGLHYNTSLFTRILRRDRTGLAVDFQDRDFLPANETPREAPNAAGRDAAPEDAGRRGFAPPTDTQDRGASQ